MLRDLSFFFFANVNCAYYFRRTRTVTVEREMKRSAPSRLFSRSATRRAGRRLQVSSSSLWDTLLQVKWQIHRVCSWCWLKTGGGVAKYANRLILNEFCTVYKLLK